MIKLRDADQLDAVKEFNLMLDVEKLIEETLPQGLDTKSENENKILSELATCDKETKPDPKKRNQFVDGKVLPPNELCFQEYLTSQVDENLWMKKTGIRFKREARSLWKEKLYATY